MKHRNGARAVRRACNGVAAAFVALGAVGCGSSDSPTTIPDAKAPTESKFTIPASISDLSGLTFFDMPWPCDLRIENGFVNLAGYVNQTGSSFVANYVTAMKDTLDGFSPAAAGYLRFTGPIDASVLSTDAASTLDATSPVQLIDVDPNSPEHGQRKLVSTEWRETDGVYWQANTLAFMPALGFPLRPHTKYAVVVTDKVTAKDGSAIQRAAGLDQILGIAPATGAATAAQKALADAVSEVNAAGIASTSIIHFTTFTTNDPTIEMFELRDALRELAPAPKVDDTKWMVMSKSTDYTEYVGWYGPSPNFQQGNIPYVSYGDGGNFLFVDGKPAVHDLFDLRFSLMIPNTTFCPMPDKGYPIMLYAHGTGGDYRSYVEDGTGAAHASQCVATMGIDEIFHGVRPGAPADDNETTEETLFFNFANIDAARTNTRQAAADEMQRARLFTESRTVVPASIAIDKKDVLLDPSRLLFFGHSQGGLNGPLYLAADDSALGGVLSGSGADISITLLDKTSPAPSVAGLVATIFLELHGTDAAELDFFHPEISLAQMIVDTVDPINYARFSIKEPRPGFAPKSIYQTEGVNPDGTGDTYAPPRSIEAHSVALGLPAQLPGEYPVLNATLPGGPGTVAVPAAGLSGNLASGKASGVLAQWAVPANDDGHFVVFDVPEARLQAAQFDKNLAANPIGLVPIAEP